MKRILLCILCLLMAVTVLSACTSEAPPADTSLQDASQERTTAAGMVSETTPATEPDTASATEPDTAPATTPETVPETTPLTEELTESPTEAFTQTSSDEVTTQPETPTEEEPKMPVEPLEITERYFIFRIWNFQINSLPAFKNIVDTVAADGFNAIKVHIPWHHVETTAGVYNYAAFDQMIDYVVSEKGMKVAISLDMTRRKGDKVLSEDDIMRDPDGNLCMGGSITGDRLQISFNSENAVEKCVAFYKDAVKHYDEKYGDAVLFYLPAFSQYAETEYWCAGEYDYSDHAKTAFRVFLQEAYGSVEALNAALGTNYASFDEVEPPAANAGDNLGKLWYSFRHKSLKTVIDRLAAAQEEATDNTKFSIQLGCVYDTASALRGTYGLAELCENVDVFWIDDGPLSDHHFSMDYVRSILPASVEIAQEIDGPYQNGATPELYLAQGLTCFERGCTYVSAANWSMDANYNTYRPVWQEIASTWLSENLPAVVQPTENTPTLEVSLSELYRRRTPERFISEYHKIAQNGEFVYVKVIDDLTGARPTEPSLLYDFPNGFSSEQGKNNWYYRTSSRKGMTDMIFDTANNRWQGDAEFCLISEGSMHPDALDTALVFKAPKSGEITCTFSFAVGSDQSDGVVLSIKHNGEVVEIGDYKNGGIHIQSTSPADGEITLTVAEGDEIAFIINKYATTSFDATAVAVSVTYR